MNITTMAGLRLLIIMSLWSCASQTPADLLVGEWTFDRFEFEGELKNIPATEANKHNNQNRGLTLTFTAPNTFSSFQKGGSEENNVQATYQLLPQNTLVLASDTLTILRLDEHYLRLFKNNMSPTVLFRRRQATP